MSDSYQTLADSRPRIRQDVLYTQTPDGVLFHNADLGFHVASASAYRLAATLLPYLNGRHTVAQLCGGLGDAQRQMVGRMVEELLERGFVRDTSRDTAPDPALAPEVARRFAAQIDYIDHYADSPDLRFARLRSTSVAVVGDDLVARWCVAGLVRNGTARVGVLPSIDGRPDTGTVDLIDEVAELNGLGCPTELHHLPPRVRGWDDLAGYEVVLVSDAAATPSLLPDLLEAGIPDGVLLLSATTVGDSVLVGPLMSAGRSACCVCAMLRFGANEDPGAAAEVWSRMAVGTAGPAGDLAGPHAAMIGNLLAYEAFRAVTGVMPAEADGAVIVQRLDTLDAATEPVAAHPHCPYHRDPAPTTDPVAGIEPAEPTLTGPPEEDDADESQRRLLAMAGRLVRPHVGVFTRFDDEQYTQIPLKVARLRFPLGPRQRRAIVAFDVHHLVGARWSALFAAAEIYADHIAAPSVPAGGDRPVVDPARLAIRSGTDVRADQVAHWRPATSLLTGRAVLVPAAAVHNHGAFNVDGICVATSAGTGSGHSAAEALGAGLVSALAFDAVDRAVRGGDVGVVDPAGLAGDPELDYLVRSAGNLGVDIELLDLGEDRVSGVHCLLARAYDEDRDAPLWTVGADFRRRRAAVRALRDLLGRRQVAREFPDEPVDTGHPLLRAFDPYTLPAAGPAPAFDPAAAGTPAAALDRIRAAGRDAVAVATAPADLRAAGISTVRVLLVDGA